MNLILLNFNNYFNRIVKKATLEDYLAIENKRIKQVEGFNQNDGVNTEKMVELDSSFTPDYLVVVSNDNTILSRWFVTECIRSSVKAYKLNLRRDVIADFYEQVVSGTCFIHKGFVAQNSPLIFNKEDFSCNQIKVNEMLLKDETKRSWIVLYYNISKKSELQGEVTSIDEKYIDTGAATIDDWSVYADYKTNGYKLPNLKSFAIRYRIKDNGVEYFGVRDTFNSECDLFNSEFRFYTSGDTGLIRNHSGPDSTKTKKIIKNNETSIASALSTFKEPSLSFKDFIKYNNKIVKTNDNKYYRINIYPDGLDSSIEDLSSGGLYDAISSSFKSEGQFLSGWEGDFDGAIVSQVEFNKYRIEKTLITTGVTTYTYDFRSAPNLLDQPFGMICLPFLDSPTGTDVVGFISDIGNGNVKEGISMLVATDLCKAGVGNDKKIFDAQILPYCPINALCHLGIINLTTDISEEQVSLITSGGHNYGFALFPYYSKFSKTIDVRTEMVRDFHWYDDYKLENQLNFFRLVSQNYNGQFEFSLAKNRGIDYINVDCTYKPYAPYIHLNPLFKGLYGQDFGDARGLVCSGDFSMTVIGDAFEQYKLQNKNYNEIFNRQIENMDTNHDINLLGKSLGLLSSVGGLAISGGMEGVGKGMGLLNAGIGLATSEMSFAEQKSYAKDMHNYQLGNIKALPNSLAKVDSYNNNNKLFPFLEKYTCTDKEKEIFETKLEFEGMTVNAIGKIDDYIRKGGYNTFVKGQMIRLLDINEDAHLLNVIYEEISKGVYFYE